MDEDDNFEYGDAEKAERDADPSDYSVHQFLASDSARGVTGAGDDSNADGDDGAEAAVEKSQADAGDDDFNSEDTPDDDSFMQLKSKTHMKRASKQPSTLSMDEDDEYE